MITRLEPADTELGSAVLWHPFDNRDFPHKASSFNGFRYSMIGFESDSMCRSCTL